MVGRGWQRTEGAVQSLPRRSSTALYTSELGQAGSGAGDARALILDLPGHVHVPLLPAAAPAQGWSSVPRA
jgi:hypothetical protein